MGPVALVALVEVFYVPNLIVTYHGKAAALSGRTEVVYVCQCRQRNLFLTNYLALTMGQTAICQELCLDIVVRSQCQTSVYTRQINITPVYADAVTRLCQNGLLYGTGLQILLTILEDSV